MFGELFNDPLPIYVASGSIVIFQVIHKFIGELSQHEQTIPWIHNRSALQSLKFTANNPLVNYFIKISV